MKLHKLFHCLPLSKFGYTKCLCFSFVLVIIRLPLKKVEALRRGSVLKVSKLKIMILTLDLLYNCYSKGEIVKCLCLLSRVKRSEALNAAVSQPDSKKIILK